MPNFYAPLPAAQVPRNALLDLSPINNALETYRQQNNTNRLFDAQQEERQYQRGRDARQDARVAKQDARSEVEWYGKAAAAVDRLQGPQRAQAWQNVLRKHGGQGLSPEELDPNTGPKLLMAEAGQWRDPREDEAANLDLQYKRAQIGEMTRKQEDPVRQLLMERLRGARPPAQGGVQPQSAPMSVPQTGVINISDEAPQQQPGAAAPSGPQMFETPFGPMSEQDARDLAGPMLLDPKYQAAGKALLDSIQSGGGGGLAKPTVNQLEERTMNSAAQLSRLNTIKQQYRAEFQQVPKRLQMLANSWTAKAGGKLSAEQTRELSAYAKFRAAAVNNLNTILKELSGAAVTPQEYERIKNDQPTAGTGIFDGDDPVSFEAKMNNSIAIQRAAIARFNFMRARGLNFDRDSIDQFLSLEDVPAAIDQRGAEIEQELRQRNPQIDQQSLQQGVRSQLKREFGI